MARRVVIGAQNDGSYGLRVALPGVDALGVGGDSPGLSFNSNWADIAQTYLVGTAFVSANPSTIVGWPSLGYIPYVEVRQISGGVVFDDGVFSSTNGVGAVITSTGLTNGMLPIGSACIYMVMKIPVGSG
jgi:hypothetical protein